jgi:hypothetical protein
MKVSFVALMTTMLFTVSAESGSLNMDFRFDYDSLNGNQEAKNAGLVPSNRAYVQTGRLDYRGQIDQTLSFRTRLRFNQDNSAVSNYNSTYPDSSVGRFVDFAYVSHQVSDDLILTFGKMGTEMAGFEGSTSGADHYFLSKAYSSAAIYNSGLKATAKIENHSLSFFAGDQYRTTAVTANTQTSLMTGVVYNGGLFSETLNIIASYHFQEYNESDRKKADSFATVGLKYNKATWWISFDNDIYKFKNKGAVDKDDEISSMVLAAAYKFEKHLLKFNAESSEQTAITGQDPKDKITTLGAAYEWHKNGDDSFRYHLAYTSSTKKSDTNADAVTEHIIAGVRLNADFLK